MDIQTISLIDKLPNGRVLVVGDIILDRFISGAVERISPEAPVPVFRLIEEKEMLGGAGNVAANLATLGCDCTLFGVIGNDTYGTALSKFLDDLKIKHFLMTTSDAPTITKIRLIAKNNHLMRMDREKTIQLTPAQEIDLLSQIEKQIHQTDVVLLSDYGKGLLTPNFTQAVIHLAQAAGKPVFIDPKGADYTKYSGADLIKPNRVELELATQTALRPDDSNFIQQVTDAARQMLEKTNIEQTIVTLSERGMIYINRNPNVEPIYLPTFAREVFDVSGAGDTSMAVLGLAIAIGATIDQAMTLGNLASGAVVRKLGTATVTLDELKTEAQIKSQFSHPKSEDTAQKYRQLTQTALDKIVNIQTAQTHVEAAKRAGKIIGFTNGVFDMLHLGHLDSLRQARAECDYLVVAVNQDVSVKRYKGPNRPVQNEQTRAQILASLDFVDLVILFDKIGDDNTATPLVRLLKPDVIAKEGYTIDRWPEAQCVAAYGGRVVTLKRLEGYSSTTLIEKMKEES